MAAAADNVARPALNQADLIQMLDWTRARGDIRMNLDVISTFASDADLSCPVVHIAGTNGKGSTAWFLSKAAPRPCGSFTSPFLERVGECISVDGEQISDDELAGICKGVVLDEQLHGITLTAFERLTVVALRFFRRRSVAFAVIECGMGGRLDSTNIVRPTVCVVTSIALDHMAFLGSTVEDIAREKAGIFKAGAHVVLGPGTPSLLDNIALSVGAKSIVRLTRQNGEIYSETAHRIANAVLPLAGVDVVRSKPCGLPPCRFEMHHDDAGRTFVIDAAHNPAGLEALCHTMRAQFPSTARVAVLCAMARDKPIAQMLAILRTLTPDVTKCCGLSTSARTCQLGPKLEIALAAAAQRADVILVCGTFDILAYARELVYAYTQDDAKSKSSRILVVDHDDSFTRNLVHMFQEVGAVPTIIRAFGRSVDVGAFGSIVLSPGPGNPTQDDDIGISRQLVVQNPQIPILGVCLGHQLLAHIHGAEVSRSSFPRHGLTSNVRLNARATSDPLLADMPTAFDVIRYNSLEVKEESLPTVIVPLAHSVQADGSTALMALRHSVHNHWGVQFHPESIGSKCGLTLLRNFVDFSRRLASESSVKRGLADPTPLRSMNDRRPWRRISHLGEHLIGGASRMEFSCRALSAEIVDLDSDLFSAFTCLQHPRVLLESSRVLPGFSRYSFVAGAPHLGPLSFTVAYSRSKGKAWCSGAKPPFRERDTPTPEDFMQVISELLPREPVTSSMPFDFSGGLVGFFGYEVSSITAKPSEDSIVPDACFLFVDRFLARDHMMQTTYACSLELPSCCEPWSHSEDALAMVRGRGCETHAGSSGSASTVPFQCLHTRDEYIKCVQRCQELIRCGESYELCLTTRFTAKVGVCPLEIFRHLRDVNPAPYGFMYDFGASEWCTNGFSVLGSSPERFLSVDRNGVASCKPMKGTMGRDLQNKERDAQLRAELQQSEKDRAENLMIVDLTRHDLSAVCDPASVRCTQLMDVETYATVHQMVSLVRGQLSRPPGSAAGLTDVISACFPAGSMTGAPKIRSMELLHELEKNAPRGVFSGTSGYLSVSGAADLAVVIRTIVVRSGTDPRVVIGAGGAITLLSDPENELNEMLLKVRPMLQAVHRHATVRLDSIAQPIDLRSSGSLRPSTASVPTLLETLLWRPSQEKEPYLWQLHYRRLAEAGRRFGIRIPSEGELLLACQTALGEAATPQRLRVLVDAKGPCVQAVEVHVGPHFPMDFSSPPKLVCLDLQPGVHSADELIQHKTLWRACYDAARQRTGLDACSEVLDAVMYNERREVTETTIANIAVEDDKGWRTPPVRCGLLPGTMRSRLLQDGVLYEGIITVDELIAASSAGRRVMCFNSVRGAFLVSLTMPG